MLSAEGFDLAAFPTPSPDGRSPTNALSGTFQATSHNGSAAARRKRDGIYR